MTIRDLMWLFLDGGMQKIKIFDLNTEKYLYVGEYGDYEGDDYEIQSIDNIDETDYFTINVEA